MAGGFRLSDRVWAAIEPLLPRNQPGSGLSPRVARFDMLLNALPEIGRIRLARVIHLKSWCTTDGQNWESLAIPKLHALMTFGTRFRQESAVDCMILRHPVALDSAPKVSAIDCQNWHRDGVTTRRAT